MPIDGLSGNSRRELRVAVIVPTRNGGQVWRRAAAAIRAQAWRPDHVLVIDSQSDDDSVDVARENGFEMLQIAVADFDHGGTRQMAAERCRDFDILVYLTQDAELADPQALGALIRAFDDPQVSVAYGRQLPRREAGPIEAHARLFNYPGIGQRRTIADASTLGLKAAFTSDSYCAYRTADLLGLGGFPLRVIVSEDMVVAARVLQAGKAVAYVADSCVLHSHGYTLMQDFRRYFDIGVLHSDESWLLREFGRPEGEGLRFVRSECRHLLRAAPWLLPAAAVRTLAKWLGYRLGRQYMRIPVTWCRRLSQQRGHWRAAARERTLRACGRETAGQTPCRAARFQYHREFTAPAASMSSLRTAVHDLTASLRAWRLWSLLGWLEIRQRYARSKLGPFWLTISMGVLVGMMGLVYGALFGQKLGEYVPMVAIGMVVWNLFSGTVSEGSNAYIISANYIRQVATPRLLYILQAAWRNVVIFAHNSVIVLVVLAIFGVKSWATLPLFLPGLVLFVLNASWIAALTGLLGARFRDLPQIVAALLQVAFYVTPILFHGEMLSGKHRWIVEYNPLAYLIDVVRQPLVGRVPPISTWLLVCAMALVGWTAALFMTGRYHKRIPYWL